MAEYWMTGKKSLFPAFFLVTFIILISSPVSGETSSTNSSGPVWSDSIGFHRTLVSVSGDGNYVIAGSDTGVLRFYAKNGTILWTHRNEGKSVRSVELSRSGEFAGAVFVNEDAPSFYANGEILFFNRTGNILWNYADDYTMERIALSDDGNTVYASGSPRLYSFDRNGTIIGQNESQGRTWVLAAAENGSYAVAGGIVMEKIHVAVSQTPANRIDVFEKGGTIAWNYSTRHRITSIGISSDAGTIVNAAGPELSSFTRNGTMMWKLNSGPDITSVAVSSDGEYIAAGTKYYLRLFNRTGTILWQYEHSPEIQSVGISDDGNVIIAGAADGIYVFNKAGKLLWHYGTLKSVTHVSVADEGTFFTASTSDTVYFFNKWGNATIFYEPAPTTSSINPSDTLPFRQPTTKASPISPLFAILAICCIGIVVIVYRSRKN